MSNVFNKRVNTTYIKSSYKICVIGCFIEECLFFTGSTLVASVCLQVIVGNLISLIS